MSINELHVLIHGLVQGVSFRATACEIASQIGVTGTVKNIPDGSVEIVVQGSKEKIEKLLSKLCGPLGPGRVDRLEREWRKPTMHYGDFRVIR